MEDCGGLLATAHQLHIQVVGVAFHVGSGATNPQAFADAIAAARLVSHYYLSYYNYYFYCGILVIIIIIISIAAGELSLSPCLHIVNHAIAAARLVRHQCYHACTSLLPTK